MILIFLVSYVYNQCSHFYPSVSYDNRTQTFHSSRSASELFGLVHKHLKIECRTFQGER